MLETLSYKIKSCISINLVTKIARLLFFCMIWKSAAQILLTRKLPFSVPGLTTRDPGDTVMHFQQNVYFLSV